MTEPLRIAICEDTRSDEERLIEILEHSTIPNTRTVFHSGEELVEAFRPGQFDLLLTDIYMGGMNGVEAVTKIREVDEDIPVAFVTTSTDFTLESYRLSVLKYIEKPYKEKEIDMILKLAKMEKDNAPSITVKKNGKEETIPLTNIIYLEQQTHILSVCRRDGEVTQVYDRLSSLIPYLEENHFFCPHKSFSVNLAYVSYIDTELRAFVMCDGTNIPIRRESMSTARKTLEDYLFERTRGED